MPDDDQILVRATLRLRNEKMIAARERLGYTQQFLADMTDIPIHRIGQLERFDFTFRKAWEQASAVADALGLDLHDIAPPSMRGRAIMHTHVRRQNMSAERLLAYTGTLERLIARSPAEVAEDKDQKATISRTLIELLDRLSGRHAQVMKDRYGLEGKPPMNYAELGRTHGISRERARQIDLVTIRKLQRGDAAKRLAALAFPHEAERTP